MFGMIYFIIGFISGICTAQEYDLPKMKPFIRALFLHLKHKIDTYSLNIHTNKRVNPLRSVTDEELNEVFLKGETKNK